MRNRTAEYQGWKNYPTWAVALWINNDEGLYNYVLEAADDLRRDFSGRELIHHVVAVLDALIESMVDEQAGGPSGPLGDLLQYAIDEVDFAEIAENFLEE